MAEVTMLAQIIVKAHDVLGHHITTTSLLNPSYLPLNPAEVEIDLFGLHDAGCSAMFFTSARLKWRVLVAELVTLLQRILELRGH